MVKYLFVEQADMGSNPIAIVYIFFLLKILLELDWFRLIKNKKL